MVRCETDWVRAPCRCSERRDFERSVMTTTPNEPVKDEDIETVGGPPVAGGMTGDADVTDGDSSDGGDADGTDA
jgi:hypothetical protein